MTLRWANPLATTAASALIIVNEPIAQLQQLDTLWHHSSLRLCADGGANRLYEVCGSNEVRQRYKPDLIKGDFDSLRADVKTYYAELGVTIKHDNDQYSTDLGKCIAEVEASETSSSPFRTLLLGGLTGRLDQTFHTLHALNKLSVTRKAPIWAFSEQSMACVLPPGKHILDVDLTTQGPTCGILPIGTDSARITTTGLEWDVENCETSFATQVSTSNHLVANQVTIETDKAVVWTVELRNT